MLSHFNWKEGSTTRTLAVSEPIKRYFSRGKYKTLSSEIENEEVVELFKDNTLVCVYLPILTLTPGCIFFLVKHRPVHRGDDLA